MPLFEILIVMLLDDRVDNPYLTSLVIILGDNVSYWWILFVCVFFGCFSVRWLFWSCKNLFSCHVLQIQSRPAIFFFFLLIYLLWCFLCSYFTNTLILPVINGPTEGLMLIYMIHFFTGFVGNILSHLFCILEIF